MGLAPIPHYPLLRLLHTTFAIPESFQNCMPFADTAHLSDRTGHASAATRKPPRTCWRFFQLPVCVCNPSSFLLPPPKRANLSFRIAARPSRSRRAARPPCRRPQTANRKSNAHHYCSHSVPHRRARTVIWPTPPGSEPAPPRRASAGSHLKARPAMMDTTCGQRHRGMRTGGGDSSFSNNLGGNARWWRA